MRIPRLRGTNIKIQISDDINISDTCTASIKPLKYFEFEISVICICFGFCISGLEFIKLCFSI